MKFVTRSLAAESTPWAEANFVTMKPWTPRNGTDGFTMAGIWMTLNDRPLFLSVSKAQSALRPRALRRSSSLSARSAAMEQKAMRFSAEGSASARRSRTRAASSGSSASR